MEKPLIRKSSQCRKEKQDTEGVPESKRRISRREFSTVQSDADRMTNESRELTTGLGRLVGNFRVFSFCHLMKHSKHGGFKQHSVL